MILIALLTSIAAPRHPPPAEIGPVPSDRDGRDGTRPAPRSPDDPSSR